MKQRRRETGETAARSSRPKTVKKALAGHEETLRALVREQSDATLDELRAQLPVAVGRTTLWRALEALKFSFKKKFSMRPSKTGRTSKKNVRHGKPK